MRTFSSFRPYLKASACLCWKHWEAGAPFFVHAKPLCPKLRETPQCFSMPRKLIPWSLFLISCLPERSTDRTSPQKGRLSFRNSVGTKAFGKQPNNTRSSSSVKTEPTNLKTSVCLICKQQSDVVFAARILNKYDAYYFKCSQCGFIQTEKPHWLGEAYQSAITSLDVGLVRRNLDLADVTEKIIDQNFEREGRFLDFAGGYGLFVRLMRDKGYNFFRQDKFCPNLFAANYDLNDLPPSTKFELVTAFEVFEHLPDPCQEAKRMLELSDSV